MSTLISQQTREFAGVDVGDCDDATGLQIVLQATLAAPVACEQRQIPNNQTTGVNPRCFFIFVIDAGIADMGISQGDQLLAVGRVGEDFLVTGHSSVENHLSG